MHVQNLEGMPLETRSADAALASAYGNVLELGCPTPTSQDKHFRQSTYDGVTMVEQASNTCGLTCTDVLAEEQAHEAIFQPLPFHYIEVAHLLLRHAKEAFEEGNDVLYQVRFPLPPV